MTTEGTVTPWNVWTETEAGPRRRWGNLVIAVAIGALLGTAWTAGVADRIYDVVRPQEIAPAHEWPRELGAEWRRDAEPVPFDHMFMKRS
jgi:hypothetical protein